MKKKILLVAKMNALTKGLMEYLSRYFNASYSSESGQSASAALSMNPPDMVLILLIGAVDFDEGFWRVLANEHYHIPVLTIGTEEEKERFRGYYRGGGGGQFVHLMRPCEYDDILEACCMRMGISSEEVRANGTITVTPAPGAEPIEVTRHTVMVVDDNAQQLRSMKSMLESRYDVVVAPSGIKAMTLLGKHRPDVILLDYEMPVVDGKQTLEMIRAEDDLKDIPVIFLTGVDDRAHIQAVLALRPAGYMLKPPVQQKVIEAIEKAVKGE